MAIMDGDRPPGRKPAKGVQYAPTRDDPAKSAGVLSEAEIAEIRTHAREQVTQEIKDRATSQLLAQFIDEERQVSVPDEEEMEIFLDLAPHSQAIMLDGRQYLHHHAYRVKRGVFQVLVEQITRGWAHDDQTQVVDSKGRRRWRPPLNMGVDNFGSRVGPWGANRNLVLSSGQALSQSSASIMGIKGATRGLTG